MRRQWIVPILVLPLLAVTYASTLRGQTNDTLPTIKPILLVGPDVPVSLDPDIEELARGKGRFTPATPPPNLTMSAQQALEIANKFTQGRLTRAPIKTTVEFVYHTNPIRNFVNKPIWKVTYWGAPIRLNGPGPRDDGSPSEFKQPTTQRSFTYVLVDPDDPNGDALGSVSSGRGRR